MQQHLHRALTFLHGALMFLWKGIYELALVAWARPWISAGVGVVVVGALIGAAIFWPKSVEQSPNTDRAVELIKVSDVSQSDPLSLVGTLRATREALVAPDISGTVQGVYRSLGDFVGAGAIIGELKNDTQRASVAQAQAALQKAQSGTAVGGISAESAATSYAAAQESARATIQSAYAAMDDAIQRKADETFSNPTSNQPHFNISTSNSELVNQVQLGRLSLQPILLRHKSVDTSSMTTDQLLAELATLTTETKTAQTFMQNLVSALNNAIATYSMSDATIAGYRTDASAGLGSMNTLLGTLATMSDGLKAKRAAVDIANENISTGTTGESADIAGARANLAIAQAGLEKTLIRAPISGTINRLDLNVGSFVNASVPVIYITSTGGLEAVAFVSDKDIKDIAVGASVTISGTTKGTVVRVASALDPVTKKAEVRIAIPAGSALVAGQSATLSIARNVKAVVTNAGPYSIPLSAIKITPESPIVFTITDGKLVSHPVTLGQLNGGDVAITAGLTGDMVIVKDARGLKEGQSVTVATN